VNHLFPDGTLAEEKINPVPHKAKSAPARREFLKFASLAALGLKLPELPLRRLLGAERSGELLVYAGTYTPARVREYIFIG
jgi:hypothetical protein